MCVDGWSTTPFAGLSPSRVAQRESQAARVNSTAAKARARPTRLLASDTNCKRRKHVSRRRSFRTTYVIVHILGQLWLSRPKSPSTLLHRPARMLPINFQPHLVSDIHLRMSYTASSQYNYNTIFKASSEHRLTRNRSTPDCLSI